MKLKSLGFGLLAAVAINAQESNDLEQSGELELDEVLSRDPVLDEPVVTLEDDSSEDFATEDEDNLSRDPEFDDLIEAVRLDDALTLGDEDIHRGRGKNNQGDQVADAISFCQLNPPTSGKTGNNYLMDSNCNDPSTIGKKGHKCSVSCSAGGHKFFYSSADQSSYVEAAVDSDGSLTLGCALNADSQLGWNVDFNYFTLRCLDPKSKAIRLGPSLSTQSPIFSDPVPLGKPLPAGLFESLDFSEVYSDSMMKAIKIDETKFEMVNNGQDMDDKFCAINKKEPQWGSLNCSNKKPGAGGDRTVPGRTKCTVKCDHGFSPKNTYTSIECYALREIKSGRILAIWSEKKKPVCNADQPPATQPPVTDPPTEPPTEAKKPSNGNGNNGNGNGNTNNNSNGQSAYFPSKWHDTDSWPSMLNDLSKDSTSQNAMATMSSSEKTIGRKQILPKDQCVLCSNARNMRKCLGQNKTCNLRKGEVCFMEVKKDGSDVLINRGCEPRRSCFSKYFANIQYNGDGDMSQIMTRPRQQCRYISRQLSQGLYTLSQRFVNDNKYCYSCHKLAYSVPYL